MSLSSVLNKLRTVAIPLPKLPFLNIGKDLRLALLVTGAVVAIGVGLGWDNTQTVTPAPYPGFHYLEEPHNPLSFFANWDAADYLSIAKDGYTNEFWVNWFPLYPITIHAVHFVVPSYLDSALLISWLSLVGAVYFYIKIVRIVFNVKDEFEPLRALIFFVLFPTGVFLIAPFSESLFSLLALASVYFALRKEFFWTAVFAMLCTATHITGMFVVVLTALILLEQKVRIRSVIATAVGGSLGLVSYMAYLFATYDKPTDFLQSQEIYHHWTQSGLYNLLISDSPSNVLMVALVVASVIYWWRTRKSFSVYSALFLVILIQGKQYGGFNRYVLVDFPVQLMLYGFFRNRKTWYPYVTAALGIAWAYFLLQYAGGYIGS
ncbi:MAG TPA: mannosyltransferase family protein [Candidatus Saccharimonadia bacterium]|nr:mannosyltransferase family protein [Candidatus Saccharimonadia bacterium]